MNSKLFFFEKKQIDWENKKSKHRPSSSCTTRVRAVKKCTVTIVTLYRHLYERSATKRKSFASMLCLSVSFSIYILYVRRTEGKKVCCSSTLAENNFCAHSAELFSPNQTDYSASVYILLHAGINLADERL